jgi:hypothetical protein
MRNTLVLLFVLITLNFCSCNSSKSEKRSNTNINKKQILFDLGNYIKQTSTKNDTVFFYDLTKIDSICNLDYKQPVFLAEIDIISSQEDFEKKYKYCSNQDSSPYFDFKKYRLLTFLIDNKKVTISGDNLINLNFDIHSCKRVNERMQILYSLTENVENMDFPKVKTYFIPIPIENNLEFIQVLNKQSHNGRSFVVNKKDELKYLNR